MPHSGGHLVTRPSLDALGDPGLTSLLASLDYFLQSGVIPRTHFN